MKRELLSSPPLAGGMKRELLSSPPLTWDMRRELLSSPPLTALEEAMEEVSQYDQ
jgi:hypothetical protein